MLILDGKPLAGSTVVHWVTPTNGYKLSEWDQPRNKKEHYISKNEKNGEYSMRKNDYYGAAIWFLLVPSGTLNG